MTYNRLDPFKGDLTCRPEISYYSVYFRQVLNVEYCYFVIRHRRILRHPPVPDYPVYKSVSQDYVFDFLAGAGHKFCFYIVYFLIVIGGTVQLDRIKALHSGP